MPAVNEVFVADVAENVPDKVMHGVDVSIVMPCLNEEATLPNCLQRAREALNRLEAKHGLTGEIVVADNGSTDASWAIAHGHGARVVQITQRGYGAALIGGLSAAHGRYLVMGDCDCSYDFVDSVPMVEALMAGHDMCNGSRLRGEIKPGAMPWKNRYIGNPVLSGVLRILFRTELSDAHCGLRALTRGCFSALKLSSEGMEFASEMIVKGALLNQRMTEVPITLWPDQRGRAPHLRPWQDGWRHLRFMLMLSPTWMFAGPAVVLALLSSVLLAGLMSQPDGSMLQVGGFAFGDHWAVISASILTVAHQLGLFALAAAIHGVREGYRRVTPRARWLLRLARLEHMIVAGIALLAAGAGLFATVVYGWYALSFGALAEVRSVVLAMTLIVLGMQTFFGGFLLSIIAGNRAALRDIEREATQKPADAPAMSAPH